MLIKYAVTLDTCIMYVCGYLQILLPVLKAFPRAIFSHSGTESVTRLKESRDLYILLCIIYILCIVTDNITYAYLYGISRGII